MHPKLMAMLVSLGHPIAITGLVGMACANALIAALFGGVAGGFSLLACFCTLIFCVGLEAEL